MKISVVIPTYNRYDDLDKTLKSILKSIDEIEEIIVVDQSLGSATKNLIKTINEKKLVYIYSKIPSITIARNIGVNYSSEKSDLICFLDDDVYIGRNYFKEIKKILKNNPETKACAGLVLTKEINKINKIKSFIQRIFFLPFSEKCRYRIISAYGNTNAPRIKNNVFAQWIPGVNMCYKKKVFDFQKFDENLLGYTIVEDIDFSYRLYKRFPNSLIITPYAKITHMASSSERYPTKRMSYVNQVDHFYFNFKNLNSNLKEKMIFSWSIFGISLLRTLNLLTFKTSAYLKWKYYYQSLFYCIKNIKKIKMGVLREWEKEF